MPYEVLVAEEFWKRLEKVGDRALGEGGQPDPLRCRQGLHLERAQVVPQEFRAHPQDPPEVPPPAPPLLPLPRSFRLGGRGTPQKPFGHLPRRTWPPRGRHDIRDRTWAD